MKKSLSQEFRVRIAPSPTGALHIGTARTALFNYLFTRHHQGKFILRIEDTDLERSDKKFEKDIIESLKWLGLNWDEEIYYQSKRSEIYQKYIKKLLDSGQAFWCYHTKEELEREKKEQMKKKEAPRHMCDFCHSELRLAGAKNPVDKTRDPSASPQDDKKKKNQDEKQKKGIIRFRCPNKKIIFNDLIKGKIEIDGGILGDISIARDEKTPLWLLANAVDDYEMKISHIIRGEDHISNTPKQIAILEALGIKLPEYGHIPLILSPDKAKLSKRHGATAISDYKEMGYLPEALNNFMAFLGWHPGKDREIFSLEELVKEFSLENMNKSNAIFNIEKLDWFNAHYIRKMDLDELTEKCIPYLEGHGFIKKKSDGNFQIISKKDEIVDFEYLKKVVGLEQERLKKLSEIVSLTDFIFIFLSNKWKIPRYSQLEKLFYYKGISKEKIRDNLNILIKEISEIDNFDKKSLEKAIIPLTKIYGVGELLSPLRVALTGKEFSPGPFEIMEVLGKEESIKRLREAEAYTHLEKG